MDNRIQDAATATSNAANTSGYINPYGQGWNGAIPNAPYGYIPTFKIESPMNPMKKSDRWAVLRQTNGSLCGFHESLEDAVSAAERLAVKESEEFIVFGAAKRVRPKPMDVETVDA